MKTADKLTSLRLVLAPLFFVLYFLPVFFSFRSGGRWVVPVLWVLFVLAELTDMFDGMAARKRKEASDFGKLYDPFADTLLQVTLFFCFVMDRILPALPFLIIVYREFGILFVRNLMLRKGVVMGARIGGKIKTVIYIAAAAAALLASSAGRLDLGEFLFSRLRLIAVVLFGIAALVSLVSFADYFLVYRKQK
jgi:CDP-diacylglycerol--glycerol-3-phosphate 3-phosphatidyltransferase